MDRPAMYIFTIAPSHIDWPYQAINHVDPSSTDWLTHLQFGVQWIGRQCRYIAPSSTDRPSQSINHVAPSGTDWPMHIQFNVQWIGLQCTYLPLLCRILTGHLNPLTMFLCLAPTGRHISNLVFNGLAGNANIYHCSVSY